MDQLSFLGAMLIIEEPTERILDLIRMCHPDDFGEPYKRWDVIKEIRRRGLPLLLDLGWNINDTFKNFYTGHEQTLVEMWVASNYCYGPNHFRNYRWPCFRSWLQDSFFSIMEHWCPVGIWEPSQLLNDCRDLFMRGESTYAATTD